MAISLAGAEHKEGTWEYRVLSFLLQANVMPTDIRDEALAILLAAMQNNRNHYPRYAYAAYIDKNGMVTADFARSADINSWEHRKPIGNIDHLRWLFNMLADALSFSDEDRMAMFAKIREWIAKDERSKSNLEDAKL